MVCWQKIQPTNLLIRPRSAYVEFKLIPYNSTMESGLREYLAIQPLPVPAHES